MSTTICGASDDLVEFEGAIYGEAPLGSGDRSLVTLKAPDGTKMRLTVEFCGPSNRDGWEVTVDENPGGWPVERFRSHDDEPDYGVRVTTPEGTTAKCDGGKVR